ncbi:hypothetical protein QBC36DRAFT_369378 [Triangularia setosa]|uniref:Uncharacterized protein n=1 Tax=Triangularia setosa TaxID=2587417 RepID=A0AAN6WCN4_9PEZI|nr:hypothetical protein QBC36DRAFT_369378 [Podospora setosa]
MRNHRSRSGRRSLITPSDLVKQNIQSAGVLIHITLVDKRQGGVGDLVTPDMIHVYDMEADGNIVPKPHDDDEHAAPSDFAIFYGATALAVSSFSNRYACERGVKGDTT